MTDVWQELAKVKALPPWKRLQGDEWDRLSDFIYTTTEYEELLKRASQQARKRGLDEASFVAYALRRWYDFHTHEMAKALFLAHPRVVPAPDPYDREADFYLLTPEGERHNFDLKLCPFPKNYGKPLSFARKNPLDLINWLYENQSREGRYHTNNRLFLVFHDALRPGETWKLRRDRRRLRKAIEGFLASPSLVRADFVDKDGLRRRPLSALIWVLK